MTTELDPEDTKLVTLARAARARTSAEQGAAVRDTDGRTYSAATVELPSIRFEALDLAVAMAVSSGAAGVEAAAVVGDPDHVLRLEAVRDLGGADIPVHQADLDGTPFAVRHT